MCTGLASALVKRISSTPHETEDSEWDSKSKVGSSKESDTYKSASPKLKRKS